MMEKEPSSFQPKSGEKLTDYEREKVEFAIKKLEDLARLMKNYLVMVDFAKEKGLEIPAAKSEVGGITAPDAPAGPDSDLVKLRGIFQSAQADAAQAIPAEFRKELEARFLKSSTS